MKIGLRSGMISERILLDTYVYCTLHTIRLENITNAHGSLYDGCERGEARREQEMC